MSASPALFCDLEGRVPKGVVMVHVIGLNNSVSYRYNSLHEAPPAKQAKQRGCSSWIRVLALSRRELPRSRCVKRNDCTGRTGAFMLSRTAQVLNNIAAEPATLFGRRVPASAKRTTLRVLDSPRDTSYLYVTKGPVFCAY